MNDMFCHLLLVIFFTESGAKNSFSVPAMIFHSLFGFASPVAIFETFLFIEKRELMNVCSMLRNQMMRDCGMLENINIT